MEKLNFVENTKYSKEEQIAISKYIIEEFGMPATPLYPDMSGAGMNSDICFQIIAPSAERNFQILVTVGFGAHKLSVPGGETQKKLSDGRTELMIFLPPDHDFGLESNRPIFENFWPIYAMMAVIQLSLEENRAAVASDIVPSTFKDSGSRMRDAILLPPFFSEYEEGDEDEECDGEMESEDIEDEDDIEGLLEEAFYCELPNGDRVEFLQLVPLYPEEFDMLMNDEENFFSNLYELDTECLSDLNRKSFMERS